jgi:hypothetical protein
MGVFQFLAIEKGMPANLSRRKKLKEYILCCDFVLTDTSMKKEVLWSMRVNTVESIIRLVWCAVTSPVVVSGFATHVATLLVHTLSITW